MALRPSRPASRREARKPRNAARSRVRLAGSRRGTQETTTVPTIPMTSWYLQTYLYVPLAVNVWLKVSS